MPSRVPLELHKAYLPLLDVKDKRLNYVFYGGRDAGKSWFIAYSLIVIAHTQTKLICCAKGTMNSLDDSVKQLMETLINNLGLSDCFTIQNNTIIHKRTGSTIIFKGLQHPDRLKSLEGIDYLWIEEANVDTNEETFDVVLPTIRKPGSKVILSFNPKYKEDYVYQQYVLNPSDDDYVVKVTYKNNRYLSDRSKRGILKLKRNNFLKFLHVYLGEVLQNNEDALFQYSDITRLDSTDSLAILQGLHIVFEKIIVALDPSGSAHKGSDACGIVVVGKYANQDRYAIIEDATGVMKSSAWGRKAVSLYHKYEANDIIYESNFGGDMIETIIKGNDKHISPKSVRATKGKLIRAEPIQAVYEEGKVDHLIGLDELELEMTTYTGKKGQSSPNRLDAMVWGITYLLGKGGRRASVPDVKLY